MLTHHCPACLADQWEGWAASPDQSEAATQPPRSALGVGSSSGQSPPGVIWPTMAVSPPPTGPPLTNRSQDTRAGMFISLRILIFHCFKSFNSRNPTFPHTFWNIIFREKIEHPSHSCFDQEKAFLIRYYLINLNNQFIPRLVWWNDSDGWLRARCVEDENQSV